MMFLSFDEWYLRKWGESFESRNMRDGQWIHVAMRELLREMREYVSEMVREAAS